MKKISFLLIISLMGFILNGCSDTMQKNNENEATYYIESPYYISNQLEFSAFEKGEPSPIKSFEIVEKSENTDVEIKLIKLENKLPKNIKSNIFKFKDLDKYSGIRFNFKTDKMSQKYGDNYVGEYFVKLKVEYYKDELKDIMKKGTHLSSARKYVAYRFLDNYNGKPSIHTTDLKEELGKSKNKDKETIIIENIQQIKNDMLNELFETDKEFVKVANELSKKMNGLNTEDKARIIYEYVCENIKYDKVRHDEFNLKTSTLDENKVKDYISVGKTLETKEGVCYDFAYLFNALAIYNNINSRIAIGKAENGEFHVWNRIYDFENNKRILVDCTFGTYDRENNFVVIEPNQDTKDIKFFEEHLIWNEEAKDYTPFIVN